MTRILAIANQKGGVGKTTTAINLGASLHALHQHVLIVDLDPQAYASFGLGFSKTSTTTGIGSVFQNRQDIHRITQAVYPASPYSFDICPVSASFGTETQVLKTQPELLHILYEYTKYDYIIIDTPPALNFLTFAALLTATECILPVQAEFWAFVAINRFLHFFANAHKQNLELRLESILLTMVDSKAQYSREIVAQAEEAVPSNCLLNTKIPRDICFGESQSHHKTILDYAPQSPGSLAYMQCARELLVRHNKLPSLTAPAPNRGGLINPNGTLQFQSSTPKSQNPNAIIKFKDKSK